MTLKQFFQLAGGFLVALIFYSAPIIGIVKWPFVIVSAVLGAALAFLPLEERPLERWIFAFFRAIYTPTMFFWKKSAALPNFFQAEGAAAPTPAGNPQQEAALKEYLGSTTQKGGALAKLEGAEQGFLSMLSGLFSGMVSNAKLATANQTALPASAQGSGEAKQEMKIPATENIRVVQANSPHLVVEEKPKEVVRQSVQATTHQVAPIIAGEEIVSTKQAIFSIDAAPPSPPTLPNVVVGQVVDQDRKIIEGAIMEIKDEMGRPIRAIRSNKVGHFVTVTPLETGRYDILTEKDGYQFSPVSFDAGGQLIPPILVQGRKIESGAQNLESGNNNDANANLQQN